jgi:hypothetical protein
MSLPPLPDEGVELGATAADWRAAVRLAGAALARTGAAEPSYADEMIRMPPVSLSRMRDPDPTCCATDSRS